MTRSACSLVLPLLALVSCAPGEAIEEEETEETGEAQSEIGTGFGLPFPAGAAYVVTQGPFNGFSHVAPYNQHAVDFGMPVGSRVVASAAGRVVYDGWFQGEIRVIIDHGQNRCTLYTHLNRSIHYVGQRVRRGEHLGESGATGRVTAPHLHWGMINCNDWTSRAIVPTDEMGTSYPVGAVARSKNRLL
jgi:murein DD-endopeptidase MepM/ murein hydrolase activator NlpD